MVDEEDDLRSLWSGVVFDREYNADSKDSTSTIIIRNSTAFYHGQKKRRNHSDS
jgi:hypothetical protein